MANGNNLPATESPAMFPRFDLSDKEACMAVLDDLTSNAKQIQEAVLEHILSQNAQTEYLSGFLHGRSDKQSFKQKVPVVTYEDCRPYIERIANGEPSDIICAQRITELITSSGTSGGVPKLFPITAEDLERRTLLASLSASISSKLVNGLDQGKAMTFLFINQESKTNSGLLARTMTTSLLKSLQYSSTGMLLWDQALMCPYEIVISLDNKQSMYCQLLYGLVQRDQVVKLGASFASTFLKTIKFLEDHWRELSLNIRTGHISDWITDTQCRTAISKILDAPNPKLADIIKEECSKKSWKAIVRKLWPKANYIEAIVTGSMAQYIPALEFYGGNLPLISSPYGCSECFFGFNVDPLCKPFDVSYTIIPNMGYFEFLEVEKNPQGAGDDKICERKEDQAVDLVDVKIGHYYEPVVTTFTGLYRYRVGDVLRATGFYNNAPQFHFVGRQKVILSIDMDKTYEEDLLKAVARTKMALEPHDLMLMDFTSRADISSFPGHYVLYWELRSKFNNEMLDLDPKVLEECCFMVEESLDSRYRKCRTNDNTVGPLEIKVVRQGTFDELMNFFVSRGSSLSQYKTPKSVTNEEALKILDSGVLSEFVSQRSPTWEPMDYTTADRDAVVTHNYKT